VPIAVYIRAEGGAFVASLTGTSFGPTAPLFTTTSPASVINKMIRLIIVTSSISQSPMRKLCVHYGSTGGTQPQRTDYLSQ
jgi:hypothetical protein